MEVADQTEEPTEDTLGFLMYKEREIFSQDSLTDSQLVALVNASIPVDHVVPPARDPETEQALEPSPPFSWYREVVEESPLVEQLCSEVREDRLTADPCLPSPARPVQVFEDLVEEVEEQSHHSEPGDNI